MKQMTCGPTWKSNRTSPFSSLINQFLSGEHDLPAGCGTGTTSAAIRPRTDIVELPEHFEVTIDLPGMDKKEISVHIAEGILTVSGERKIDRKVETDQYSRIERGLGEFQRSFRLPDNVETQSVKAEYENGVLTLQIKKREETLPKKIEVTVK